MPELTRISSGSSTEAIFGYCRVVQAGDLVSVAGTTAMTPDGPVGGLDPAAQTGEVLRRISAALESVGSGMSRVVRTRVFVTDIDRWEEVGAVHREWFGANPPVSTIVEVSRLFHPHLRVEIEADAVVADRDDRGCPARSLEA